MTPQEEIKLIDERLKTAKPHERKILEVLRDVLLKQTDAGFRDALDEMFEKGNDSNLFNFADVMDSLRNKK